MSKSNSIGKLAAAVAPRVAEILRGECGIEVCDQRSSGLPPRSHCELTRRLAAAGDPRAAIIGRKYLITRGAIFENLRGLHAPQPGDVARGLHDL